MMCLLLVVSLQNTHIDHNLASLQQAIKDMHEEEEDDMSYDFEMLGIINSMT
jgi:hypothetical protein